MFNFKKVDPTPLRKRGSLDTDSASQQLMALDIVNKYVFTDEHGSVFHECELPADADIYNCGGYADKVAKYRDPQLYDYLKGEGVSEKSLESDGFPILATQSPKLDLILFEMIKLQRRQNGNVRVSLFDLGCTVAEHYDLLDVFFQTEDDSAANVLDYTGLDQSSLVLIAAKILHPGLSDNQFSLVKAEGSQFEIKENQFDFGLSVGVVNHVVDPHSAIQKLLVGCRLGVVMLLWVTKHQKGTWLLNHSGIPFYFFSQQDLCDLAEEFGMTVYLGEFTPQEDNSQPRSFAGVGSEIMEGVGSYQVVFSKMAQMPMGLHALSGNNDE